MTRAVTLHRATTTGRACLQCQRNFLVGEVTVHPLTDKPHEADDCPARYCVPCWLPRS